MVEIAMALPLFILVVMIFVWLGMALNARTSLKYAMVEALALARQRAELRSSPAIESVINNFRRTDPLLVSGVPADAAEAYYNSHDILSAYANSPTTAWRVYALIFTYEAMKKSLGNGVRYPCSPDDAGGDNCLACAFAEDNGNLGMQCRYQPSFFLLSPIQRMLNLIAGGSVGSLLVFEQRAF